MAVSRAAASRMAITRISVGIRSRYVSPLPTELSLKTLPRAVAMAICAEGSVGKLLPSQDSAEFRQSTEAGETVGGKRQAPRPLPDPRFHPGAAPQIRSSPTEAVSSGGGRCRKEPARPSPRSVGSATRWRPTVASAVCRSSGLKRRKAMISGRT